MHPPKIFLATLLVLTACSRPSTPPPATTSILFEGARLIVGDGSAPVDNSAFLIEQNKFTRIGKKGEIETPAGAQRIDLTGKTVMPALIDTHSHLGHFIVKSGRIGRDTYSRENLVDHLQRYAYYGISATQSMGLDRGEIPYQVRADPPPNAALFHTAGRGLALPNAGPGAEYWKDAAYGVTTEAEARQAVQELAAKKVDLVKMWVDDRNGTVKKLPPVLYRAIIDEAHKNNLRAVAHIYYLSDAKDLLRAGIDGFAHSVRDKDIDDEFIQLFKERPDVFLIPNLPDNPDTMLDAAWLGETVPAAEIQKMRDAAAKRTPDDVKRARAFFQVQARNLAKLNAAGLRIGFGTDAGTAIGWNAHEELADMVTAGMTPSQVITAATKTAAEIMKFDQLGTVATGKSADFIVLDANPLDNIANTRRISAVYLRGKQIDRAALRAAWTTP
jgi:imidazolonepropionase-like amidohydrolase